MMSSSTLCQPRVCYIPTLTREISTFVYESVPEFFSDPYFLKEADPAVLEALQTPERMSRMAASRSAQAYKAGLEVAMGNVGALHAAAVPIAMGTDTEPPARFQGTLSISSFSLWLMPA